MQPPRPHSLDLEEQSRSILGQRNGMETYRLPPRGQEVTASSPPHDSADAPAPGHRVGGIALVRRSEPTEAGHRVKKPCALGMVGQDSTVRRRRSARLGLAAAQVRVIDVASTICYLTGAPMPRNVEGGIYEAVRDPDLHRAG